MAILQREGDKTIEVEPGLFGRKLVDGAQGARRVSLVRGWMRPGARHSPHTHDVEEAVIFLSGRGVVDIAGTPHTVGPGDLLSIPPHTVHSTFNPGDRDLCFVAAFADCMIAAKPLETEDPPSTTRGPRAVRALRRGIAAALFRAADILARRSRRTSATS